MRLDGSLAALRGLSGSRNKVLCAWQIH